MKTVLFIMLIAAVIAAALFLGSDARNSVLLNPQGYIASGSRFGVTIGDSMDESIERLDQLDGVEHYRSAKGGVCIFRRHGADMSIEYFRDRSWRGGVMCLVGQDGRVREVVWQYQFGFVFP